MGELFYKLFIDFISAFLLGKENKYVMGELFYKLLTSFPHFTRGVYISEAIFDDKVKREKI